jgi:hypothetical protein
LSIILKVYDGGKLKMARAFKGSVRLGTGDVELQLQGANVASSHALIELGATAAVLRATSAAPLFLNGQPILAAPLRTGDLITVGALRVMVELREPAKMVAPQKRARFQVIDGEADTEQAEQPHMHAVPSLSVVRGDAAAAEIADDAPAGNSALEVAMPPVAPPAATPIASAVSPLASPALAQVPDLPPPPPPPRPTLASVGSATDIGFVYAEVHWGDQLLGVQCVEPGTPLTAGEDPGCNVFLPGVPRAELVTSDTAGWQVRAPAKMSLALTRRGVTASGHELLARGLGHMESDGLVAPLAPDACGVLRTGSLSLRVRVVPEQVAVGRGREDWRGVAMTSIAAFALVLAMGLMHKFLPAPKPVAVMPMPARPYVVKASSPTKDPAPVEPKKAQAAGRTDPGKAFARHLGREGMAGSKMAPRRDLRAEKKRDDAQIVAQMGLLKALKGGKGTSAVFGTALGTGARDALGHLDGPRVGDARGDGGAGLKSLGGTGGGGDGSGLGLARIGTNGVGGGLADYGDGRGAIKGKTTGVIGLVAGKPEVTGEIDPELIRKVVHDHRAQIRACYELELNQKPKLAGKVTSAWTIDSNGVVTESHVAESTLGDKNVERCVTNRIKTWRFPLPKGGGEVFVTYPFLFTRGG